MKLIAEIIGYIAILCSFVMFQQSDRKRLIFCKLIMDFLWIAHFVLLGGYTVACTTFIAVFRELVFYNRDKRLFNSPVWLGVFIALYAMTPIITWEGIYSIFPAISSIIATVSFWLKSVKKTKLLSLFVAVGQLIYEISIKSYAAVTNEIVTVSSILISFARGLRKKQLPKG